MYMLAPDSAGGTNSAFRETAISTAFRKSSVGGAGMLTKPAECARRMALESGRKRWIELEDAERKAFSPS